MANNPIPFNPVTMEVRQLLTCAETLRTLFDQVERKASDEAIVAYLEQARDFMLQQWGEAK